MSDRLTPPEALIYAMVAVSAADRKMTADEISRIGSIVRELPPFLKYNGDWLAGTAQECGKLLGKPHGFEKVLEVVKNSLPAHLHETAYVLAAEVAASDLEHHDDEERFLAMLAAKLGLDKLTCAALERAAKARHQKV
jgi:tellurite resistance protein